MRHALLLATLTVGLIAGHAPVDGSVRAEGTLTYRVSITNVTNAQSFTPVLAATHRSNVNMFLPGTAASAELRALAEGGDIGPLMGVLSATSGVADIASTDGLLARARTSTFEITSDRPTNRLSLAAMLIPTNDAFVGLNTPLPTELNQIMVVYASAYDSGTERNDELCASIPGPSFSECNGPGGGATVGGGEGAITIHRGIRGGGDFDASVRDWRNPVARISIERIS